MHDLIGAEVRDRAGARIGRVDAVQANPAHELLVLDSGALDPDRVRGRPRARCRRGRPPRRSAGSLMRIDVFTIFPDYLAGPLARVARRPRPRSGSARRARARSPASATTDVHRSVDDAPFGGGAGMVMMPEPLFAAVEAVQPAAAVAVAVGERTPLRSGACARARGRRRVLAAVRPLRRRRPTGRRPLLRRRALGRRLRARRRARRPRSW